MSGNSSFVDWNLAERVAVRVADRAPFGGAHHLNGLTAEFDVHTARAEDLVAATTGLRSLSGDARARVVGRDDWIRANVASLQRLLRPLFDRLEDDAAPDSGGSSALTARMGGMELGLVLGWMSTRVLGQYDLLVVEDEAAEDQDIVYYVGPNLVALERRYAFPRHDFRLWLALHEVTHRAQFTGVPWMRAHYLGLVQSLLDGAQPESFDLVASLKSLVDKRSEKRAESRGAGQNDAAAGSGVLGAISSPEQQESLDRIAGLMSLLEGHGDVTMGRAGEGIVQGADRMARVMADRRRNASGVTRLFQRLVGLEAKLAQYAQGETFIGAVEAHGGTALLDRVWEDPSHLPDLGEIREPDRWIERLEA